ncbi:hypothetical protein GJ744_005515 [Endocarpon pusillum]|uniref:Uncharacterized protein n=1 Tax=Endocarpon pusillum TaxID=364733 RepID=A0A8H7E588_9EURO|nr:hypothetical protein GJ744_005515 [Endocarpon pusillum]
MSCTERQHQYEVEAMISLAIYSVYVMPDLMAQRHIIMAQFPSYSIYRPSSRNIALQFQTQHPRKG